MNFPRTPGQQSPFLSELVENLPVLFFSVDPDSEQLLSICGDTRRVLGVDTASVFSSGDLFLRYIFKADRFEVQDALEARLSEGKDLELEYLWERPDNHKHLSLFCRAALSQSETPILNGFIVDCEQQASQAKSPDGDWLPEALLLSQNKLLVLDRDFKVLFSNIVESISEKSSPLDFHFGDQNFDYEVFMNEKDLLGSFGDIELKQRIEELLQRCLRGEQPDSFVLSEQEAYYELKAKVPSSAQRADYLLLEISPVTKQKQLERDREQLQKYEEHLLIAQGIQQRCSDVLQSIIGQSVLLEQNAGDEHRRIELALGVKQAALESAGLIQKLSDLEAF